MQIQAGDIEPEPECERVFTAVEAGSCAAALPPCGECRVVIVSGCEGTCDDCSADPDGDLVGYLVFFKAKSCGLYSHSCPCVEDTAYSSLLVTLVPCDCDS